MPHLLNVWPSVSRQLNRANHVLLLFDYDGTLSPIAPHPDLAVLPPRTRNGLITLERMDRYTVGVISGRGLDDVRRKVAIPELIYAGNHGLEMEGSGWRYVNPEAAAARSRLDRILAALDAELTGMEGVFVEGKGLTLSVHYRLTPQEFRPRVMVGFEEALARATGPEGIRVTRGKEVLEVRPEVDWHKGKAVEKVASAFPAGPLVCYFGDDLTDEDGFAAVHELNGLSVFVGPARQPTRAVYRLDSPAEVAKTLDLMARLPEGEARPA